MTEIAIVGSVLALVASAVTAILARRSAKEANTNTAWSALAAAHQAELARLSKRIDQVEKDLADERAERRSLAAILRSAWSHILRLGDQVRTLGGNPEQPPADLTAWMHQDGLVVDRVETTISRTLVTDTRDPESTLEHRSEE